MTDKSPSGARVLLRNTAALSKNENHTRRGGCSGWSSADFGLRDPGRKSSLQLLSSTGAVGASRFTTLIPFSRAASVVYASPVPSFSPFVAFRLK